MSDRLYTKNGEWVAFDGSLWRVGLSSSAVADLGDVTFVELPAVGRQVTVGEAVCTLEAVKAAADYYCPVEGRVAAINDRLVNIPQLVNTSPEEDGWLFALEAVPEQALRGLLKESEWKAWEAGL